MRQELGVAFLLQMVTGWIVRAVPGHGSDRGTRQGRAKIAAWYPAMLSFILHPCSASLSWLAIRDPSHMHKKPCEALKRPLTMPLLDGIVRKLAINALVARIRGPGHGRQLAVRGDFELKGSLWVPFSPQTRPVSANEVIGVEVEHPDAAVILAGDGG
jgi:hypothetical protein